MLALGMALNTVRQRLLNLIFQRRRATSPQSQPRANLSQKRHYLDLFPGNAQVRRLINQERGNTVVAESLSSNSPQTLFRTAVDMPNLAVVKPQLLHERKDPSDFCIYT